MFDLLSNVCAHPSRVRLPLERYFFLFRRQARVRGFAHPRTRAAARGYLRRWRLWRGVSASWKAAA